MPGFLKELLGKMQAFWSRTSLSQRIFIGGLALAVTAAFFVMLALMNRDQYKVLYTNLDQQDAAKIVEKLKAQKEKFQIEDGGKTILVPEAKAYELRLKIAGEGGLTGQGVGFEIFDELKVGQTDFVQKINYQRALQGELQRTIAEFPEVEKARVHLVIPKKSLFIEEQAKPSASIVLKMKGDKKLEQEQVMAVVNLVTLSVEGLDKQAVTVADASGKRLYSPSGDKSMDGMTTSQLDYKRTLQGSLERRIEEMLFPVVGAGKVIAKVNADLDFSQRTTRKELYDPEKTVVRSEQRSEESTQGRANAESGVPEANFRGDGVQGALSQQQTSREARTTNFEINKEEHSIVGPMGEVTRLSVAVIVDGVYEKGEKGEPVFTARKEEDMKRLNQLVRNAVGFDSARGDQIEVTSISFGGPDKELEPSLTKTITEYGMRLGRPILNAILIFMFLLLVVRPVIMALIRPRVEGEAMEGLEGLPQGEERLALVEADEEELEAVEAVRKIEDIKAHAMQLSEQNMEQAVGVIRGWLKTQEGA